MGVVDDVLRADLGGVGEQALERAVGLWVAGEQALRPVVSSARRNAAAWRLHVRASRNTDGGGASTWTNAKPAASKDFRIGGPGHHSWGTVRPSRVSSFPGAPFVVASTNPTLGRSTPEAVQRV